MHKLKGRKQSPEHIQKRVEAFRGYTASEETKEKIRQANLGKKYSQATKNKHSQAAKKLGLKPPILYGSSNPNWKGDNVSYRNLHSWVERKLGTPSECSNCGSVSGKRFHWANISHEYKRDITDWMRLCVSCHLSYDRKGLLPKKLRR